MKLLIAEDDHKTSRLLVEHFSSLGHRTESATNQQQAWQILNNLNLNAILLNRYLNNADSMTFVVKIRRSIDTPIIMLSASNKKSDITVALDNGVDDYLIKPFDLSELEARLYALLRRKEQLCFPETIIPTGQGHYDLKNHEFIVPDKKIRLTKTECQLLGCLLYHKGKTVSKAILQGSIAIDGHALNNHITNLRKKLNGYVIITAVPSKGFLIRGT